MEKNQKMFRENFDLEMDLADSFKLACVKNKVSKATVLRDFVVQYIKKNEAKN